MSRSLVRAAVAAAAGCAAALAVAALAPAAGASAPSTAAAHRALGFAPVHIGTPISTPAARGMHTQHVSGYNQDGQNWSGYVAQGSGFSSVTSNWTEPDVTCNSTNDLFAPWVGIDGYGSSTVEQTGVATDCSSGSPTYSAWYEMYPASPVYYSNPVQAGDSITATVDRSGTSYTLTLSDNTQGWSKTTTQSLSASNASVEVIMESPTGSYPNFGSVDFSGSTVDGSPFDDLGPTALDASNSNGFEDHTSAMSDGNFSIAYEQE